jgi:hypothetical protein
MERPETLPTSRIDRIWLEDARGLMRKVWEAMRIAKSDTVCCRIFDDVEDMARIEEASAIDAILAVVQRRLAM